MAGFHAFPGGSARAGETPEQTAVRELEEETGVQVGSDALTPIGHWVTPPFAAVRFDTRFFLAELPSGKEARVVPGELESGEWITPDAALSRWDLGEVLIAPPILHLLRVAALNDVSDWPAAATAIPEANGGEVTRIEFTPAVVVCPLRAPTLPPATHVNCYVIGLGTPVILDPGSPEEGEQRTLDRLLETLASEGRRPSRIVITHHHVDHVAGVNHLAARLAVPVAAHPRTRELLAGAVNVDETLTEGQLLPTGASAPLQVLFTPGHAQGHVALVQERTGALFSGDLILGMGTTVIDPPDGDLADYLVSLERLAGMPLKALFPGHGPVLADTLARVREYIAHRKEREGQVVAALRAGDTTPEAIVRRVYADVPVALHPFAARSVLAHLLLLEKQGRARVAEGTWRLL